MPRCAVFWFLGCLALPAVAADPPQTAASAAALSSAALHSEACEAARSELDALVAAVAPGQTIDRVRLAAQRRNVLQQCLAQEGPTALRPPSTPIRIPSPAVPPTQAAGIKAPAYTAVAPQPLPARPAAITSCDATGCWDSNGTRLNQLGPQLIGPKGPCTVVAGMATCP